MKNHDRILIFGILLAALLLFAAGRFMAGNRNGGSAAIYLENKEYGRYPLDQDVQIRIGGSNTLSIREGKADMTEADCPDKLCVKQKPISKKGETLVCLPNQIVVAIEGNSEERDIDAVAN